MSQEDVEKILQTVNSDEFKDKQAALTTDAIHKAVEVQQIPDADLAEARKAGKVHGDPIFTMGKS